ncbi:hypothetical protein D9Q98_004517 [Chlorella vulgaris]|uniref:Cyclin-like domain-containing protein n=1 Tax=Chlorella vulgaris TaxID=3077 RepID=A0A9D4TPR5_CHLVU|nr:hypothetical protein D9Q98_004517 [Chlorella vulgaris]
MIYSGRVDNFYLTAEQLAASPSRADGVDEASERELRRYCCDVVAEAAVLLRLPQVVAATAQVLVQRFYCKRSLKAFDVKVVAMAAFWLACKLEEVIVIDSPARLTLRNLITVMDRIIRRRDGRRLAVMDPYSQRYEQMKQEATKAERLMLRALGFVLHVEHPHRFVLNYCQILGCGTKALQQEAWNMSNDSLRTTLCVRYRAEVVACGILFTAARKLKVPMPESPPWWLLFEVTEVELADVCATLSDLYQRPKAQHISLLPGTAGAAQPVPPPGAKSPLSTQATPLQSPASQAPSTVGSLAALPAASAEPPRGSGLAPSAAQKQGGSAQQAGDAGERSTGAANGSAPEPAPAATASDARQARPATSAGKQEEDSSKKERRRSPSRSGSRSQKRSRSRSRSRDRKRRSRSRDRKRSRSRSRSRGRDRSSRRDRRDDQPVYRAGSGKPPRRDERRREERGYRSSGGTSYRR